MIATSNELEKRYNSLEVEVMEDYGVLREENARLRIKVSRYELTEVMLRNILEAGEGEEENTYMEGYSSGIKTALRISGYIQEDDSR